MFGAEHFILAFRRKPYGPPILAACLILIGLLFAVLLWPAFGDYQILHRNRATIMADVENSRIDRDPHLYFIKTYLVLYSLRLEPRGFKYVQTERGPLGRHEVWTSVSKDQWDQAVASGKVAVVYYPPDPRINQGAEDFHTDARDYALGAIITLLFLDGGSIWMARIILRQFNTIAGPQPTYSMKE